MSDDCKCTHEHDLATIKAVQDQHGLTIAEAKIKSDSAYDAVYKSDKDSYSLYEQTRRNTAEIERMKENSKVISVRVWGIVAGFIMIVIKYLFDFIKSDFHK